MGMYDEQARVLRPDIEPGRRVLVISDIHANLLYFHGLLKKVSFCNDDMLILNGDFLEKGAESLRTLREVMALTERGNVIPIMGNCDDWAAIFRENTRWTKNLQKYLQYRRSGLLWDMALELGLDPLRLPDFEDFKGLLAGHFAAEFAFLGRLPHAAQAGRFTFAHAAVYPDRPLEAHTVGELLRCEAWYKLGYRFDNWVVVGHYPVMLYFDDIVCANPIIDHQRHIACIDGACVLKDDGQLNCLIIPDIMGDDVSFEAYDPFPVRTVLSDQAAKERSAYIRWGDSRVQVLEHGEEFSRCRHVRTGYELDILTKYLFTEEEFTGCNDCTDYVLPLRAGDRVGVVETCSRGYFVKHNGVSGWYFGALSEE